jgi:hypothetical protein
VILEMLRRIHVAMTRNSLKERNLSALHARARAFYEDQQKGGFARVNTSVGLVSRNTHLSHLIIYCASIFSVTLYVSRFLLLYNVSMNMQLVFNTLRFSAGAVIYE